MFDTVLIANRGEIACRVIATCRRMGIRTVAVYSDADLSSRFVRMADVAIRIGPAPARDSYLSIPAILDAAKQAGAQAIHPGYGFLSENAEFAEACAQAGIIFIGPTPAAIRAMGSKAEAKRLMRKAGVPLTPGYDGSKQDAEFLATQATAIGFPVMIKASAGGGGKGMRRVDAAEQFAEALAGCKREALAAFGDDAVLLEKYMEQPRHVEVQVFGDTHGNIVSLFERDCSVQRRHQKVIEEAPAPLISKQLREALGKAARDAARAVEYVGAGTVEFLLDREGGFHFMEMNTRLQVEHPVTEFITGLDLVEWQLRVAAGEPLPLRQEQLTMRGHAIEARIYAEDPEHNFLPSIGRLVHLKTPASSIHVRIDTGVEQGDEITPYYDPMIAKLIVWDETRELALQRLERALGEYQIVGLANNLEFLRKIVTSRSFAEVRLNTGLIEQERSWIESNTSDGSAEALAVAALAQILRERNTAGNDHSPWARRDGWRLNGDYRRTLAFFHGDDEARVLVQYRGSTLSIASGDDAPIEASGELHESGHLNAVLGAQRIKADVVVHGDQHHVFLQGRHFVFTLDDPLDVTSGHHHAKDGGLRAPMPGRVVAHLVEPGQPVERGASLMVLEAMKMECTIHAPEAGHVETFHFAPGDQVSEGAELLSFQSQDAEAS